MAKTRDAAQILRNEFGGTQEFEKQVAIARMHVKIAQMIYDARSQAGLTQTELASRVGTSQSQIARLEDADYQGHSLDLVARIALVLGSELDINFGSRLAVGSKKPRVRRKRTPHIARLLGCHR